MTKKTNKQSIVLQIKQEVDEQLKDEEVMNSLIATTFNNLSPYLVRQALVEGMLRGFTFNDFLKRDIYAIPFSNKYTLIASIDYCRKVGMQGGIVGKKAPVFTYKESGEIDTCEITIEKKIDNYVGSFTALVAFDEYYKATFRQGKKIKGLWDTKPKTMIAKVAEMHALRMACPEELSKAYIEEEMGSNNIPEPELVDYAELDNRVEELKEQANQIKDIAELRKFYAKNRGLGREFDEHIVSLAKELKEEKPVKEKENES